MSLMGNLYLGNSGLRISSNSLNTTAHNITNADTDGYTRQQVSLVTSTYNTISKTDSAIGWKQVGLGVTYAETRQVRDYFLDVNYRREFGRSDFYRTSVDALNQVEDILGESTGGKSFSTSMDNLWTSVEELLKDPCNEVNQNLLVTRSYEFMTQAGNVFQALKDYQLNLNVTIRDDVKDINELANRLEELNINIMKIESAEVENANDLRDERNYILDKLSSYGSITWDENLDGYVSVQLEGSDLVKGGVVHEIGLYQDPQTQFYTVFWTQNARYTYNDDGDKIVDPESLDGAEVFDLSRPISSDLNTDIGSLKSALYARGDHVATFKDIPKEPSPEDYVPLGAADPAYIEDVEQYNKDLVVYDRDIAPSIMMNIEAEFDQLVHDITTAMNQIFMDAADKATALNPNSSYLRNSDGTYLQLFELKVGDNELSDQTAEADKYNTYMDGFYTTNIRVNMDLRQSPSLLGFRLEDGSEDIETMRALSDAFSAENYTLNPNVTTPVSFLSYYNSMVSQVSNSGSVYTIIKDAQDQTINSINSAREQVLGVNTDEELTYMIQFQNAYNAASRYINVVSQMLEHLVTSLT